MITTYAELKSWAVSRLNRPNVSDAEASTFVQQAEVVINRLLKHRQMEAEDGAFDLTGRTKAIPADFLSTRSWRVVRTDATGAPNRIAFETLDKLENRPDQTGIPCFYSKLGSNFVFWPTPDSTVTTRLGYRQRVPALSDSVTSNWVLDDHSDIYVAGVLAEGYAFIKDEAREDRQRALFLKKISDLNMLERDEESQPLEVSASGHSV